jgi:uncharacterized protein (DUF2147 family)
MTLYSFSFRGVLAALAVALVPSAASAAMDIAGTWINPKGTVAVQTEACSSRLCGRIVWVSAVTLADSKESGVDNPIGIQLLKNYRRDRGGTWHGLVYVPDLGRSFQGL